jgi:DNA modification methylase
MFEKILRVSANTVKVFGHVYVCSDWRSWPSWWEMAKRTPLEPKNCIIWDKGGGGMGNNYANTYEMVGFYTNMPERKAMYNAYGIHGTPRQILQRNMVRVDRARGEERQHNAAKPVDLISYNIEPSTDEGGLVVDWFLGSGSTLITAEKLGRVCYGMEIDPKYVQVAIERWQNYTGQKAIKL